MATRSTLRLSLSCAAFSLWLALLFAGFAAGGAVHLLLLAALLCFPWRQPLRKDATD